MVFRGITTHQGWSRELWAECVLVPFAAELSWKEWSAGRCSSGYSHKQLSASSVYQTESRGLLPDSSQSLRALQTPPVKSHQVINMVLYIECFIQSHSYIRHGNRRLPLATLPGLPATSHKHSLCFLVQFPSNCHAHRHTFAKRRC